MASSIMIIPARAGSKGVPKKNIRELAGIPLIAYLIKAALASNCISNVYVSTDGQDIADVAADFGAKIVIRPPDISGDFASSEDAVLHALEVIEADGEVLPNHIFFGQCTSPLTHSSDFDKTFSIMEEGGYDSVFAAKSFHGFIWRHGRNGNMEGVNHDHTGRRLMRQEMEPEYQETGAFYLLNTDGFRQSKRRFFGNIGVCAIPSERCIDIDTLEDFDVAEKILNRAG